MEIFDSVLGKTADADWKGRLKGARIDWLELSQWDAQKNRFRKASSWAVKAVTKRRSPWSTREMFTHS